MAVVHKKIFGSKYSLGSFDHSKWIKNTEKIYIEIMQENLAVLKISNNVTKPSLMRAFAMHISLLNSNSCNVIIGVCSWWPNCNLVL